MQRLSLGDYALGLANAQMPTATMAELILETCE